MNGRRFSRRDARDESTTKCATISAFKPVGKINILSEMKFDSCLKQIGRNLRAARLKNGLRQIDIEEKTGLTYRHYQSIEVGKVNMTLETLYRLSRLFKVEISELVQKPPNRNL